MILPVITYGSLLNLDATDSQRGKLLSLHRRGMNIANCSSQENFPSPYSLSIIKSCEFVWNCLDKNICDNFTNYFKKVDHCKTTRNCSYLVKLPKVKLKYSRSGFYYMGAKLYNDLPLHIRKIETFDDFKRELTDYASLNF